MWMNGLSIFPPTVLIATLLATGVPAQDSSNGLQQKIPLCFCLGQELKDREKKLKANPTEAEVASCWFLKALLQKKQVVHLSASSVRNDGGLKIEKLCDPVLTGATGIPFEVPGVGKMYGELTVKWGDPKIIRVFEAKSDLAFGRLVFEIRITREEKEITVFTIRPKDRFVIFEQNTNPERVYLFNEKNEIVSTGDRR